MDDEGRTSSENRVKSCIVECYGNGEGMSVFSRAILKTAPPETSDYHNPINDGNSADNFHNEFESQESLSGNPCAQVEFYVQEELCRKTRI